jgi:hypothetical protein
LGILEIPSSWVPGQYRHKFLREVDPHLKHLWIECMTLEIIISLGGPFAQARCQGGRSKSSARWDALFGGGCCDDYKNAGGTISDMRAMAGRGSLLAFEARTYDLVKRCWSAIDALGEQLLERHVIEYDEAVAIVAPLLPI